MKFRQFLEETGKEKHAVLAFGRMNPPTTGHAKLVDKVKEVANKVGGSHHVVLSHSQDKSKNPLSAKDKLKHARRFFPDTNLSVSDKEHPNFLTQAAKLHKKGVTHLHMVAGSDRVGEYHKLLHKYNGTHEGALFNFKHIKVHSAGQRDPDAEGTEGMSASKMRGHATSGNFKEFRKGIPSHVAEHHAKELYHDVRNSMGVKEDIDVVFEEYLTEGVHDKGIFKAVFLAGGPGSGKDYVLDNTLSGHGLTEINSDKALEYLMDKEGLDKRMPEAEKEQRDVVRGKAKNMTELRQRLAIQGRNGLIINGTGDDAEKIAKIKERLENMGYDTHMLVVNTKDEVSAARNVERGQRGGRTVPEELRKKKWQDVQNSRPELAKMFGQNYVEFDNSEDLRNASPEVVKAKKDEMLNIFKTMQKFVKSPPKNEQAKNWIAKELQSKDSLKVDTKAPEATPHPNSAAAEEARKLGLEYYGFGRYGKDNKVTYRSIHDKLQPVQNVNEEFEQLMEAVSITISGDTVDEVKQAMKLLTSEEDEPEEQEEEYSFTSNGAYNALTLGKVNEDSLNEDLRKWFDPKHPKGGWKRINSKGEAIGPCAREPGEPKPKCMSNEKRAQLSKKERASAVAAKRKHDPNPERKGEPINVSNFGKGKISEASSLEKFRAAAAQREKEHEQRRKEMEARHAQGKEDMKGAIDTLAQTLNKEETLDEVSVNTLQSYKQKASQDAIHRAATGKGGSLDRFLNVQKAKDKIQKQTPKIKVQQTAMSESNDHLLKDNKGKVRVFMLRRAAAKEAHQNGGVVYKQGNGYVIKIKESEDVSSTNKFIQEQERSRSSTRISSIREERGSYGTTEEQSGDCGCSCGETKETSGKSKITLREILSKKKEAVKESIDRGIEPGLSLSASGENLDRGSLKTKQNKKPLEELTGDETGYSIGDQKEDELKKKGINLSTFKTKNYL